MENVAAIDTPDDDGGRITVSWDVNTAEDCTFYAIFIRLSSGGLTLKQSHLHLSQATVFPSENNR